MLRRRPRSHNSMVQQGPGGSRRCYQAGPHKSGYQIETTKNDTISAKPANHTTERNAAQSAR